MWPVFETFWIGHWSPHIQLSVYSAVFMDLWSATSVWISGFYIAYCYNIDVHLPWLTVINWQLAKQIPNIACLYKSYSPHLLWKRWELFLSCLCSSSSSVFHNIFSPMRIFQNMGRMNIKLTSVMECLVWCTSICVLRDWGVQSFKILLS